MVNCGDTGKIPVLTKYTLKFYRVTRQYFFSMYVPNVSEMLAVGNLRERVSGALNTTSVKHLCKFTVVLKELKVSKHSNNDGMPLSKSVVHTKTG